MMIMNGGRNRHPFTPSQWQELEHQALVYKYMISGIPIPPDLLFTIRRSLVDSKFLLPQPQHIGWSGFHMGMGFGRKIDPEPGRCRRTDGKKWRCSKEAYPDSKYCERHMHRGRNRSRKPVEILSPIPTPPSITTNKTAPFHSQPSPVTISSSSSCYLNSNPSSEPNFLYPHLPFSKPQETPTTTKFYLDSNPSYRASSVNDFRNSCGGVKGRSDEDSLFSESSSNSGTLRSMTGGCSEGNDFSWKLTPLEMRGKQNSDNSSSDLQSGMKIQSLNDFISGQHYYNCDMTFNSGVGTEREEEEHQPNKVMHHFFDEWSPKDLEDKSSATTQLSISMPNSMHDFFITPK